jgi:hypothetical protein
MYNVFLFVIGVYILLTKIHIYTFFIRQIIIYCLRILGGSLSIPVIIQYAGFSGN